MHRVFGQARVQRCAFGGIHKGARAADKYFWVVQMGQLRFDELRQPARIGKAFFLV